MKDFRNLLQSINARVHLTAFETAKIVWVNLRTNGKFFLRPTQSIPHYANIAAYDLPVYHAEEKLADIHDRAYGTYTGNGRRMVAKKSRNAKWLVGTERSGHKFVPPRCHSMGVTISDLVGLT